MESCSKGPASPPEARESQRLALAGGHGYNGVREGRYLATEKKMAAPTCGCPCSCCCGCTLALGVLSLATLLAALALAPFLGVALPL